MIAFFLLVLGAKTVVRKGQATIRRFCPRCGDWRNFQAVTLREYLTFFFIPVFPVSAPREGYVCVTCGLPADGPAVEAAGEEEDTAGRGAGAGESLVVQCPRCDGRMRVPLRERGFTAVCPHCTKEFAVKGQREPVPDGKVKESEEF